jgi:membrane-bound acyltransferase YfiQ involved in biofilm formation
MAKQHVSPHAGSIHRIRDVDHLCVDNVRFWSMFAIMAVHSLITWGIHTESRFGWELQVTLLQALKFGTIGFYIISGFLLGLRVDQRPPYEYLLRRLKTVGLPWLIWAGLFTLLPFAKTLLFRTGEGHTAESLEHYAATVLLFSPYWFVPNFFFALSLLLLLRRYLDDVRIGFALLAISVFYGVNIYGKWVRTSHTYAVFGFVFYLWLGSWASRHSKRLVPLLDRIRPSRIVIAILVTAALALAEAHVLQTLNATNIVNTLRLSNQLFSVVVVIGLMKLGRPTWPKFVDVRAHTFGLYLVHPIMLFVLARVVDVIFRSTTHAVEGTLLENYAPVWAYPTAALLLWASIFVLCYSLSLGLVSGLFQVGLSWTVGRASKQPEATRPQPFVAPAVELRPAA